MGHGLAVPDAEIIEHNGHVTPVAERDNKVAADIAGTAGDQKATRHAGERSLVRERAARV